MRKVSRGWMLAFLLVLVLTITALPVQAQINTDGKATPTKSDGDYYFVELEDDPVATYDGDVKGYEATQVEGQKKLSMKNNDVKRYQNFLSKKRSNYKSWLKEKSSKAKVVEEYSVTLNGVAVKADGINPDILRKGPGVKKVVKSLKYKPAMNRSHSIIQDKPLWKMGYKGEGIKVAVIDSGIDQNHPFLTDKSLNMPEGYPKVPEDKPEWKKYTTNKVIAAKVFSPDPDVTPEAIGSHGTHVAGTIAGVEGYKDPSGAAESPLSGVAPKAYLGNYNVFPCDDCSAESIHIAAAVEAAVKDGMDVANLSLGGEAEPGFDLLAEIVNAATDAGMTVVIAAGNEGPGSMTIGSPGTADKVITVGAVTNGHFIGTPIQVNVDGEERTLPVATSDPGGMIREKVEAPLQVVADDDGKACSGISADLTGKLAVIKRGDCTFTEKGLAAQEKGAVGVVLINNSDGDPSGMSVEESVTIPMVMVSLSDGDWILSGNDVSAMLDPSGIREFPSDNDSLVADFSSRGPTVNYTLKPDVAAVGANVYSSVVGGGLSSYNGTSMATPHVAGAAALLKQARPSWTPQDIKAALMATAQDPKGEAGPLDVGAGIINVHKALNPAATASPASLSFGLVNKTGKNNKKTYKVTLKNTTSKMQIYTISTDKKLVKSNKSILILGKGKSGTFEVTALGNGKTVGEDYQGYINIATVSKQKVRIPFHYRVVK